LAAANKRALTAEKERDEARDRMSAPRRRLLERMDAFVMEARSAESKAVSELHELRVRVLNAEAQLAAATDRERVLREALEAIRDGRDHMHCSWNNPRPYDERTCRGIAERVLDATKAAEAKSGKETPEPTAHGCTHLTPGCCAGRKVCTHGIACTHGACCHACWRERCPEAREP
jgi:hypothetical protein